MHRRWTTRPDLHEVLFGLQGNQNVMPIRRDDYIFDLLFEVDTAFAAELIEEYKSPYQPAIILEFGACVPRRMFGHWERLMQHAQPAFEEDGTWNNRILLPLLLYSAQDATRSNPVHQDETEDGEDIYTAEITALAECVSMTLWKRPDGCAAALRWSAWLFRSIMSTLDSEGATYPRDIHSRAFPEWRIVQAAVEPQRAANWLEHTHQDVESEDELCVVAVKILAAHKHKLPVPGRKLLFEMLPDEPEEFLECTNGKRLQRLPSLFTIWGKRADAFGTRILSAALFDGRVAENFGKLWNRTLVLREIVEHSLVFKEDTEGQDDSRSRASETIAFVVSLGINLIDYIQDKRDEFEIEDRHRETLSLLSIMHDATREMIAIDPIGRGRMQHIHDHLCVRRLLYEAPQVGEPIGAAPLYETDCPTAGDLLFERSEISRSFFNCLQMLLANGVTRERIKQALSEVGLRLEKLVEQAQTLNVIEHNRKLNLEGL